MTAWLNFVAISKNIGGAYYSKFQLSRGKPKQKSITQISHPLLFLKVFKGMGLEEGLLPHRYSKTFGTSHFIVISTMINHNPYNLPERMPQKHARIYTEANSATYRQSDSIDNCQNYPHYANRHQSKAPLSPNTLMKKSNNNLD